MEDILQGYDPFSEPPKSLAHFRIAAAALDRLENPKWLAHWKAMGVNRKDRREMLRRLKQQIGKKHLPELRRIAAMAKAVRRESKAELGSSI